MLEVLERTATSFSVCSLRWGVEEGIDGERLRPRYVESLPRVPGAESLPTWAQPSKSDLES